MSPTLTLTMGVPGSGKSTWASSAPGAHISVDEIRTNRTLDRGAHLLQLQQLARALLRAGTDVTVDACSTDTHQRRVWMSVAHEAGGNTRLVVLHCPPDVAARRNAQRDHPVPDEALPRYAEAFRQSLLAVDDEPWGSVQHLDA